MNDNVTYLLVLPDATLVGDWIPIIERLLVNRFRVEAAASIRLDLATMVELYSLPPTGEGKQALNQSGTQIPKDIAEMLYDLAPALLLVMSHREGNAAMRLPQLKCPTRPELATDLQLRSLGDNIVMNRVHAPDGPVAALQELPVLLGSGLGASLTERFPRIGGSAESERLIIDLVQIAQPVLSGRQATSFAAVGNRLICRALLRHSLSGLMTSSIVGGVITAIKEQGLDIGDTATSTTRMLYAQQRGPGLCASVAAVVGEKTLTAGLAALAELYDPGGNRGPKIMSAIEGSLPLSHSERATIHSHALSFRNKD